MSDKEERAREKPATGFPEPPGDDPGDLTRHDDPHHTLNNPVGKPDPTEWPDPYEKRDDPRGGEGEGDDGHTPTGSTSTSEPHPSQDIEADQTDAPERDNLDD